MTPSATNDDGVYPGWALAIIIRISLLLFYSFDSL